MELLKIFTRQRKNQSKTTPYFWAPQPSLNRNMENPEVTPEVTPEVSEEVREDDANESKGNSEEPRKEKLNTTPTVKVINIDQKAVMTTDETARYMGISKAHLYTLTMKKLIPHYKPMGKVIYFLRSEVESWLQGNRVATLSEIESKAKTYCMKGGLQCAR